MNKAISSHGLVRSIAYQTGSRVRGMLRNPSDYLLSSSGRVYDEKNTSSLVHNLRLYLEKNSISGVPDRVLLQVLTHKSFAHGKKPYNEKLAVVGTHLLRQACALHYLKSSEGAPAPVEGLDFDSLRTAEPKYLLYKSVLADFARSAIPGIEKDIFWRNRNILITDPHHSGENLVLTDVVSALVGAVDLFKGQQKALDFVENTYLSGEESLVHFAKQYLAGVQSKIEQEKQQKLEKEL